MGNTKKTKESRGYTLNGFLERGPAGAIIFHKYKEAILKSYPDIKIKPKKFEMGFLKSQRIVVDISIFKKYIKIWLNLKKGSLNDPKSVAEDVSGKGHWGNGDYEIKVTNISDFKYVMRLIKQAIE